jgi:hypothetical protein
MIEIYACLLPPWTSLILQWFLQVTQQAHRRREQLLARGKALAAARGEMLDAAGEDTTFLGAATSP